MDSFVSPFRIRIILMYLRFFTVLAMSQSLADQLATTALSGGNAGFIEDLYEQFLKDPDAVDPDWADYFRAVCRAADRRCRARPDSRAAVGARQAVAATARRRSRRNRPAPAPSRAPCRASSRCMPTAAT